MTTLSHYLCRLPRCRYTVCAYMQYVSWVCIYAYFVYLCICGLCAYGSHITIHFCFVCEYLLGCIWMSGTYTDTYTDAVCTHRCHRSVCIALTSVADDLMTSFCRTPCSNICPHIYIYTHMCIHIHILTYTYTHMQCGFLHRRLTTLSACPRKLSLCIQTWLVSALAEFFKGIWMCILAYICTHVYAQV